jgi:hypothetical protein
MNVPTEPCLRRTWRWPIVAIAIISSVSLVMGPWLLVRSIQEAQQRQAVVCALADFFASTPFVTIPGESRAKFIHRVDARVLLLKRVDENDSACNAEVQKQVGLALRQARALVPHE